MSSVVSSLGTCSPRKLSTLPPKDFNTPETSRIKILNPAQKSSLSSEQVLHLNNEKPSLLRRREAIGFGFCFGLVDVLLPAQPTEAAEVAPCEFTVAPSGLAYCDKVVGYGAEAVKGQMIKVEFYHDIVRSLQNNNVLFHIIKAWYLIQRHDYLAYSFCLLKLRKLLRKHSC